MKLAVLCYGLAFVLGVALAADPTPAPNNLPAGFSDETVLYGLKDPIDVEFLSGGRALVVEISGLIYITSDITQNPVEKRVYLTIEDTDSSGEKGLMDIALAPDFDTAPIQYIYAYYSCQSVKAFRISRFIHFENGFLSSSNPASEFVIFEDVDKFPGPYHFGGQINFGPDGAIYLSQGDKTKSDWAQDMRKYSGKVIRVNPDGTFPADNLGVRTPGALPGIWMLGVRNGFRSIWDLETNRYILFIVGGNDQRNSWESLFFGGKDLNLGWPLCEGYCDPANPNPAFKNCDCSKHTSPVYSYPHEGVNSALIGGVVYRGTMFPVEYRDKIFIADFTRMWVKCLEFDATGTTFLQETTFSFKTAKKIVSMKVGPEGALYYSTLTGEVGRYVYETPGVNSGGSNRAPVISSLTGSPRNGGAPLKVSFNAVAADQDGDALTYTWYFGDEAKSQASGKSAKASFTYTNPGTYLAYLQVSDSVNKAVISDSLYITVQSSYTAKVVSPIDGTKFKSGDLITTKCSIDGTAASSDVMYTIVTFKHDDHTHPVTSFKGSVGSFEVPSDGHEFRGDTGFYVRCSLQNSKGEEISADQVFIAPTKVYVPFDTNPSTIPITIDGVPATAPFILDTLVGFTHEIEVQDTQICVEGYYYKFKSWSDGGDRVHGIKINAGSNFVATFAKGASCSSDSGSASGVQLPSSLNKNLVMHFDASLGVTSQSGAVTGWVDLAGSNTLKASTTSSPILFEGALSGYNYISFSGTQDLLFKLTKVAKIPSGDDSRTVLMVVKYRSENARGGFGWGSQSGACDTSFGLGLSGGKLTVETGSKSCSASGGVTSTLAGKGQSWFVHGATYKSGKKGSITQYKNLSEIGKSKVGKLSTTIDRIVLGADITGEQDVDFDVAEILVFNTVLKKKLFKSAVNFLMDKYQL